MKQKFIALKFAEYEEKFLVYVSWKVWIFFGLFCIKRFRIEKIVLDFSLRHPFGFMLYSFSGKEIGNLSIQFWVDI